MCSHAQFITPSAAAICSGDSGEARFYGQSKLGSPIVENTKAAKVSQNPTVKVDGAENHLTSDPVYAIPSSPMNPVHLQGA